MKDIVLLLRPHQWLKNGFIFLPLFFDRHLFDIEYFIPSVLMFLSYCFVPVVFIVLMTFGMLMQTVNIQRNVKDPLPVVLLVKHVATY